MSYKIVPTIEFEKELKKLAKKYLSLKTDLQILAQSLSINPVQGVSLGNICYKIRLAITSKGKGKSGGARIITFVKVINEIVLLITIYDNSLKENITTKELNGQLKPYLK
jgi:mRNA-degrading endonuclease RelE of RelBE toxin-antitoxin system